MKQFIRRAGQIRRYSSRIPPSKYHEHGKDYLLRKDLVDTRFLPNSSLIWPVTDRICKGLSNFNSNNPKHLDHRITELLSYVAKNQTDNAFNRFESLYYEDNTVLKNLSAVQCSSLLRLIPTSPKQITDNWPKMQLIFNAIKESGHLPRAPDYSRMIQGAFHSKLHNKVASYWKELGDLGVEKSTVLWNSYIMATCSGHPWYWTERTQLNYKAKFDIELEPPISNDAIELFKEMSAEGNQPDARTYELLILWFAKNGDMDGVKTIVRTVWGGRGDLAANQTRLARTGSAMQPSSGTLSNLIQAFACNKQLAEGLDLVDWMQRKYDIRLNDRKALQMWNVALYWAFVDRKAPRRTFDMVWRSIVNRHKVEPTFFMYYLRLRFLQSGNNVRLLKREAAQIHERQPKSVDNPKLLVSIYINRATRLMLHSGLKRSALNYVNRWAEADPAYRDVQRRILQHLQTSVRPQKALAKRNAYKQQRQKQLQQLRERERERSQQRRVRSKVRVRSSASSSN